MRRAQARAASSAAASGLPGPGLDWLRIALLGAALVLALPACSGLLFQPMRAHLATPADFGLAYRDVTLTAADGVRLHAWQVSGGPAPQARILVLHGNAENVSTHGRSVFWLSRHGYELFLLDYRGYGRSAGSPSIPGVHRDAAAALDHLLGGDAGPALPVIVLGQSLGGAIAIAALARHPRHPLLRGLVADGAFVGYRDIAREKLAAFWLTWPLQYPLSWTFGDEPRPLDEITRLPPLALLLIGGSDDPVVPLHHAEALYAAAPEPKALWRVRGRGHIAAFADAEVRERLLDWLWAALAGEVGGADVVDLPAAR